MKKIAFILACTLLSYIAFTAPPTGTLPHVAIAGFANRTGDASFDTPAATATESLALTIRLLGSYELVAPATAAPGLADKELIPWCEGESVDYVLYGSIGAAKGGAQEYSLALFDRAKGKTTIRKTARGTSVFDVFSCADTLTFAVIDAIAGRHVGFGSIAFDIANPGAAEGTATVFLDGSKVAEDLTPIDRVVEGRHLVSISWSAKGSKPREIALVEIEVAEGECATVSISLPERVKARATAKPTQPEGTNERMVFVEGGTFTMGSDTGPLNERPAHEVTVGSFWMGKTEVTQGEFERTMRFLPVGTEKGFSQKKYGIHYPVLLIDWVNALEYCNAASLREGYTPAYIIKTTSYEKTRIYDIIWDRLADGYRLPTEAEWEYAAKGGSGQERFSYPGSDTVSDVAVTMATANGNGFEAVASRKPNTLGIYDLGGNVYEWCWDTYASYRNPDRAVKKDRASGMTRVIRGGDSLHSNTAARCTARSFTSMSLRDLVNHGFIDLSRNVGFRVVRSVIEETE